MGLQEIQTRKKKKKVYVAFSNTCNKDRGADLRGSVVVAASSVTCLLLFFPPVAERSLDAVWSHRIPCK